LHLSDVGRVPDQPDGLVAALGQQALEQERDLAVPTRDHHAHAASLLAGSRVKAATPPAGRAVIIKGL
jgi:hypothetical protein